MYIKDLYEQRLEDLEDLESHPHALSMTPNAIRIREFRRRLFEEFDKWMSDPEYPGTPLSEDLEEWLYEIDFMVKFFEEYKRLPADWELEEYIIGGE